MPALIYENRFGATAPAVRHSLEDFVEVESEDVLSHDDELAVSGLSDDGDEIDADWPSLRDRWEVSDLSQGLENLPAKPDEPPQGPIDRPV